MFRKKDKRWEILYVKDNIHKPEHTAYFLGTYKEMHRVLSQIWNDVNDGIHVLDKNHLTITSRRM